jgi:hypothetical protein
MSSIIEAVTQMDLGLQIPSEVEQALKEEAKKRELLKTFLDSGALIGIETTVGKIDIDGSNQLLNGWNYSVYYRDDEQHDPEIHLDFTRDEEGAEMRNLVHIHYSEIGKVEVRGSKYEFPVFLNRPNRPNTRMENLREAFGGKLRFKPTDWYFGNKHLLVDGSLNPDLPGAVAKAFANPSRYRKDIFSA